MKYNYFYWTSKNKFYNQFTLQQTWTYILFYNNCENNSLISARENETVLNYRTQLSIFLFSITVEGANQTKSIFYDKTTNLTKSADKKYFRNQNVFD